MQAEDAKRENKQGIFWEAHQVGLEYSQIERLHNLAALPPTGFTISCFPLKVIGASGAPARVVASVP
jgi:kynurenine formamidase